jgi:hypothetical protein
MAAIACIITYAVKTADGWEFETELVEDFMVKWLATKKGELDARGIHKMVIINQFTLEADGIGTEFLKEYFTERADKGR